MATRTKPLLSAVSLASAAAIAVATPAIVPSVSTFSPHALSAAKVQLATFADLLSITPEDWNNVLFDGYGGAISPFGDPDFDWAAAFISPFVACDFDCLVNGPSGIAYLALDALINGNGTGYTNVLADPSKLYQPDPTKPNYNDYVKGNATWSVSAVNYFFEGGAGPGFAYLLAQPFGDQDSPLYNPTIAGLIVQAFNGLSSLTNYYIAAVDSVSKLAANVPLVGPYVYGALQAYLGPATSDEFFGAWGYFAGLSGILRYVTDVILTGGNPLPPYGDAVEAGAATRSAAAVTPAVVEATPVLEVSKPEAATEAGPAPEVAEVAEVKDSTPAVDAPESTPAVDAPESTPAAETPAVDTPAVSVPDSTPAEPEVKPVATPAAGAADEAEAPAPKTRKRPVRDAVEKVGKQLSAALGGSKAKAAADAGGADTAPSSADDVS